MTEAPSDQPVISPAETQQFTLLLDLVEEVNQGAGREEVFTVVADTLRRIFGIDRFAVVLAQDDGLRLALSFGLSPPYVRAVQQHIAEAPGARALAERRPILVADAPTSAEFWPLQEAAHAEGFHTVLILPFFAGTEPLGYLIMYHDAVREYTAAEIMLAQMLTQQAALAVQQTRLRGEAEARRDELERAFQQRLAETEAIDGIMLRIASSLDLSSTLQSITASAATLSNASSASMYLRDERGLYRAMAAHGVSLDELRSVVLHPTDGLMAHISRTGEPFQVTNFGEEVRTTPDARKVVDRTGTRATLAVPLMQGNECTGALYVASIQSRPFSAEQIRTLQRLSAFAQVAVQNAQRFSMVETERARLQAYLDAIPEGVMILDRAATVLLTNEALRRELGTHTSMIGHTGKEILSDPSRFHSRPLVFRYDPNVVFTRILETGKPEQGLLELEEPHQTYEVHLAPLHDSAGRVEGIVATMRDITVPLELERERSRANLLAQLLDLSAILNSDLTVAALTEQVVVVAMSLVGARTGTLGLIEGDKLVFRRFHQPDGWVDFDVTLHRGQGGPGHVWESMTPYLCNDCTADPHVLHDVQQRMGFDQLVIVPIINRSGKLIGTLNVYDPIVERDFGQRDVEVLQLLAHQGAIAIENARLNETRDAFLSIVSHELKTPVTSIKGFAQVLQRRLPPEALAGAGRYLDVINQQTDRLAGLINDLLDLSRIQTGRFHFTVETIQYGDLLRDVVDEMQLIAPRNPIELTAPDRLLARGNANRLRQVLVNLIDNAVQHGPANSTIRVSATVTDSWVTTCVRDEGPGLPPGESERIFGPYYQVRSESTQPVKGLGLGLYISRQVVNEHGGEIWVDQEKPTTFCFTIPAAESREG
jgi:signal transduction histidine kinase/PAS domain-containing protein